MGISKKYGYLFRGTFLVIYWGYMSGYRGFSFFGFRVPEIGGTFVWGPHTKDYSRLGSILGSPYFGKLPYFDVSHVYLLKGGYIWDYDYIRE